MKKSQLLTAAVESLLNSITTGEPLLTSELETVYVFQLCLVAVLSFKVTDGVVDIDQEGNN